MRLYSDIDLHAFVDDQVGPERRTAIASYLSSAPADAARVELWRRQNAALKAVFAPTATEAVPLWLTVGQIAAEPAKPVTLARRTAAKPLLPAATPAVVKPGGTPRGLLLVVAALAFAAGLATPYATARLAGLEDLRVATWAADTRAGFVRRVSEAHSTVGVDDRPGLVPDRAPGRLRDWLEHRLTFTMPVPDLTGEGWRLDAGHLAPGDLGPAATLVYRRGADDRLTLYVARVPSPLGQDGAVATSPDGVVSWSNGSLGYGLVSTVPGAGLAARATVMRSAARDGSD